MRRWRHAADPDDHDAAELVDAADRRARIVDAGNRAERNVDDLDHAELDILLHGARRADIEGGEERVRSAGTRSARETRASGTPAGTNWPTRRSKCKKCGRPSPGTGD